MWAPLLQNNDADTRVQCHFMKGAAKAGWGTMLKRLMKKKGKRKKKKQKTKTDIHILWIKNPAKGKKKKKPVQQLIEF